MNTHAISFRMIKNSMVSGRLGTVLARERACPGAAALAWPRRLWPVVSALDATAARKIEKDRVGAVASAVSLAQKRLDEKNRTPGPELQTAQVQARAMDGDAR
jgi:hypothetical protein